MHGIIGCTIDGYEKKNYRFLEVIINTAIIYKIKKKFSTRIYIFLTRNEATWKNVFYMY